MADISKVKRMLPYKQYHFVKICVYKYTVYWCKIPMEEYKDGKSLVLRLCLFWLQITFGNAFPYMRVFGCAWKINFPEVIFS